MKFRLIMLAAFILACCMPRPSAPRRMAQIFKEVAGWVAMVVAVDKVFPVPAGIQQTMGLGVRSGVLVSRSGQGDDRGTSGSHR